MTSATLDAPPAMSGQPVITTSWDDGHLLDFRLAEMLGAHNLRATFYIPRQADTGTMSESQVRQLSGQFEIGAHTLNHVFLDRVSDEQARTEIRDSKKWVEDVTGKPCTIFCPPAGKFAQKHLEMVREAQYTGLRSVEFFSFDRPRNARGLWIMPTTIQANPNGFLSYARNIARRMALRNLWTYVRYGHSTNWESLTRSLLAAFKDRGGVFHLWGHSWELQEHRQWARLAEILRILQTQPMASQSNGDIVADCNNARFPVHV